MGAVQQKAYGSRMRERWGDKRIPNDTVQHLIMDLRSFQLFSYPKL